MTTGTPWRHSASLTVSGGVLILDGVMRETLARGQGTPHYGYSQPMVGVA